MHGAQYSISYNFASHCQTFFSQLLLVCTELCFYPENDCAVDVDARFIAVTCSILQYHASVFYHTSFLLALGSTLCVYHHQHDVLV